MSVSKDLTPCLCAMTGPSALGTLVGRWATGIHIILVSEIVVVHEGEDGT